MYIVKPLVLIIKEMRNMFSLQISLIELTTKAQQREQNLAFLQDNNIISIDGDRYSNLAFKINLDKQSIFIIITVVTMKSEPPLVLFEEHYEDQYFSMATVIINTETVAIKIDTLRFEKLTTDRC